MGLFGKLLDKKVCDICGAEIGLLGNRKLEDGNCCKNCAGQLSPWFDERRHSTIADIKEQLIYREENKNAVSAFHMTRTFGNSYNVLMLDEDAMKFCVGGKQSLQNGNPDIIDAALIRNAEMVTDEHRSEIYRKDKDGKNVSYEPKRYEYSYSFRYVIDVEHPYFDKIKFDLSSSAVKMNGSAAGSLMGGVLGGTRGVVGMNPEYDRYTSMGAEITNALNELRRRARNDGNDVQSGVGPAVQEASASAPVEEEWICPYCDSKSTGDKCIACGANRE